MPLIGFEAFDGGGHHGGGGGHHHGGGGGGFRHGGGGGRFWAGYGPAVYDYVSDPVDYVFLPPDPCVPPAVVGGKAACPTGYTFRPTGTGSSGCCPAARQYYGFGDASSTTNWLLVGAVGVAGAFALMAVLGKSRGRKSAAFKYNPRRRRVRRNASVGTMRTRALRRALRQEYDALWADHDALTKRIAFAEKRGEGTAELLHAARAVYRRILDTHRLLRKLEGGR